MGRVGRRGGGGGGSGGGGNNSDCGAVAPLYSSGRVARGGVAAAVLCRAAGARRANIRTGETRVVFQSTHDCWAQSSESIRDTRQVVVV